MLRFDPDDLTMADCAHIEAIDTESGTPWGTLWPEGTPLLRAAKCWASYAHWQQQQLDDELDDTA